MTALELHQPFHYIQETDPGAVGAGLIWFKKSTKVLSYRNDANTGWITILASSSGLALAAGSDWDDFMTAYNSLDPGDTIYLPNDTIIQESNLFIQKEIRIVGTGPNSNLKLLTDVTVNGGALQFGIGYGGAGPVWTTLNGVELAHFTIEHDRATVDRTLAIGIYGHSSNIHIHDIIFKNITSDCIITRNESTVAIEGQAGVMTDIFIHNCTGDEWYESFFNHHEGSMSRCYVYDNTCTVSEPHPNAAVSVPYGLLINIEEDAFSGLIEDVHFCHNSFTSTMTGRGFTDSIGYVMRHNEEPDFRATRVYLEKNFFSGWYRGLWHIETQHGASSATSILFPGTSFVYYNSNRFELCGNAGGSIPSVSVDDWGSGDDIVFLGDNDIVLHANDPTGLVLPASAATEGIWPPVTITESPPNRVT